MSITHVELMCSKRLMHHKSMASNNESPIPRWVVQNWNCWIETLTTNLFLSFSYQAVGSRPWILCHPNLLFPAQSRFREKADPSSLAILGGPGLHRRSRLGSRPHRAPFSGAGTTELVTCKLRNSLNSLGQISTFLWQIHPPKIDFIFNWKNNTVVIYFLIDIDPDINPCTFWF